MYWKKLDDTIRDYINHPESKFDNGRQYGKESNELEETEILGLNEKSYIEYV